MQNIETPKCRSLYVPSCLCWSLQQTQSVALRCCNIGTLGVRLGFLVPLRLGTERRELRGVRGLRLGLFPTGLDTSGESIGDSSVQLSPLGHRVNAAWFKSSMWGMFLSKGDSANSWLTPDRPFLLSRAGKISLLAEERSGSGVCREEQILLSVGQTPYILWWVYLKFSCYYLSPFLFVSGFGKYKKNTLFLSSK